MLTEPQDTVDSVAPFPLISPGVRSIDQRLPFQRSTRMVDVELSDPTARHETGDGHDTLTRLLSVESIVFGVGRIDQPAASADGETAKHHARLADTATTANVASRNTPARASHPAHIVLSLRRSSVAPTAAAL
jgi:hypothetical protein